MPEATPPRRRFAEIAVIVAVAVAWTLVFFRPLWRNEGIVGGDVMTYFVPQKAYLCDALAKGDVPLWCNTVALGYPFVADSQIALWYPTTIPLYSMFSPETGLHINLLLHYVFAYVGAALLARQYGLSLPAALFAALAFTYGWFPPRLTVEWAVTTGSYIPWALLCAEKFIAGGRRRPIVFLAALLTLQLLAGHFGLTFITHATLPVYAALRTTIGRREGDAVSPRRAVGVLLAAQVLAFPLAACQLLPTWELRQLSERSGLPIPDVDYGRVPWQHLKQLLWPPAAAEDLNQFGGPATNQPAASLYVGVLAVLLSFASFAGNGRTRRVWWVLIPISVVFAVGWVTPIYKHLPGFGYFKVPGRYGVVAAVGFGLLSGIGFDVVRERLRRVGGGLATVAALVIVTLEAVDLYSHSRAVTFVDFVPIHSRDLVEDSTLAKHLRRNEEPPRVWAFGQNTLAVLGLNVVPGFVGLPPDAYVDEETRLPDAADPSGPTADQLKRASRYGVTDILFDDRPDRSAWDSINHATPFHDPFLTRVMQRLDPATGQFRPFYHLELSDTRGRVAMKDRWGDATLRTYEPDVVEVAVATDPQNRLILTDLFYPGWNVSIDGNPAEPVVVDEVLRGVDVPPGQHLVRWEYRPASVTIGWLISCVTAFAGGLFLVIRPRSRQPTDVTARG